MPSHRAPLVVPVALLGLLLAASCGRKDPASTSSSGAPRSVVTISAVGLAYEAPDTIPSGWVTFRFENESPMTHFAVLERMPEGIGVAQHQTSMAPVFQRAMSFLNRGLPDSAKAAFGALPPWFGQVVFSGGPGLTGPGGTCDATVPLEPGTYLIECYVKTAGVFHSTPPDPSHHGMVHQFTVTSTGSGASEPKATVDVTVSAARGIEVAGEAAAGPNVIAVHFADQMAHENFVGHDLHLVRLAGDTNLDSLAAWMNWMSPRGLQTPAPAEFVGGLEEMPAGRTGYLTVTLEPGRYAWISEVPHPEKKNMLKTFTVGGGAS